MDSCSRARNSDAYSSVDLSHEEHVSRNLLAEREKERRRNRCDADLSFYFVPYKNLIGMMNYRTQLIRISRRRIR